ncbi:SfnB family sulfur acquisition oxidoreductase, partial [Beijerinckia sp. L45]|uniref:SfnB family sulfur acquisition oxidoreductase n=1 Tax=Beijerinckia sp. L45 TaxID=1641855 RepID=UPI001FF0703D
MPEHIAHIALDDAEALAIAERLAAAFAVTASERDRERRLPFSEIETFSQSGLWSMNVPRAYGGPAVSYATVARVFAIIAAGDASIAHIAQNHISLIDVIRLDDDEARKHLLLGAALRGVRFGNAQAERSGKTALDVGTRIVRVADHFEVTGEKIYATGALFAHLIPVSAVDDDGKKVLAFVASDAPGVTVTDDWSGFGQRTTGSGRVTLDQVRVEPDHVVPAFKAGEMPTVHGAVAQIIHAAIDAGIARRAIDETIAFVRDHARPWADSGRDKAFDDPFTIRDVADLKVRLHAAEAVLSRAGKTIDAGLRDENAETAAAASIAVAEAKVLTTEIALLATNKLFELSGTRAVLGELNLDRHWRDARVHTLHDPVRWK